MKTIALPKLETAPAKDFLRTVLVNAQSGATLEEVRRRIRILDAIDSVDGDALTLEDADHQHLQVVYNSFKFGAVHKDIITLSAAIDGAS
jgi:hypothetical protein